MNIERKPLIGLTEIVANTLRMRILRSISIAQAKSRLRDNAVNA